MISFDELKSRALDLTQSGVAKAKELIFSGKQIGAEEAKRIGLVNEVYAAEELLNKAVEMAKSFTANAPIAVK